MASFGGLILTNKGRALQAKAQAGTAIVYTRIGMGDGNLGGQQMPGLTALISAKKYLPINKITAVTDGKTTVSSYLSNAEIITGFYFRELGLFATDPDEGEILYCYGNAGAGAEYIPAGGGPDIVEKYINVVAIVGNAANVSANIDNSLIFVEQPEFNDHVNAAVLDHPDNSVTDPKIGNRTADPNTSVAYGLTGRLTQWVSWITKYLKAITGKPNPFDTPDITLAATKTHVDDLTRHITAAERTTWNAKQASLGFTPENAASKNQANGYAGLDSSAKLPASLMPALTGDVTSNVGSAATTIAANVVTDSKIGNRTATDSVTPSLTGTLTALLSSIFTLIKGITGKASVLTAPAITLEAAKTSIDALKSSQSEAATVPATIKRGLNVINTSQASPAEVTVQGRTLINLLGRDGNCEDYTKFGANYSILSNDSMYFVYGSSSMKIVSNGAAYATAVRMGLQSLVDKTKYYLLLGDVRVGEAASPGKVYIDGAGMTGMHGSNVTNTTGFSTSYLKIQPSDMTNMTGFNVQCYLSPASSALGKVAYFDGVRLYEITAADYARIGVDPEYTGEKLAEKFPYVDSIQSLQMPVIRKKGKNMLAPYSTTPINTAQTLTLIDPYTVDFTSPIVNGNGYITVPVVPNTDYTFSCICDNNGTIAVFDVTATVTLASYGTTPRTFNSGARSEVRLYYRCGVIGTARFKNQQLELGNTATQFQPQNDDYLYMPTTLTSNVDGSVKDTYNSELGTLTRRWKTGTALDGTLAWTFSSDNVGNKVLQTTLTSVAKAVFGAASGVKYDGKILPYSALDGTADKVSLHSSGGFVYVSVPDVDSGWGDTYTPTTAEIKAYFDGWKMNNGTLGTPYNGTGTKSWTAAESPKANFVGKVSDSTVANPHIIKYAYGASLAAPSVGDPLTNQSQINALMSLDGVLFNVPVSTNLAIAQHKFSFNLIEHVLRNYGVERFGTAVTLAERVEWLKENVGKAWCNAYVTGSGPAGNKVSLAQWKADTTTWSTSPSSVSTNANITKLTSGSGYSGLTLSSLVDVNGFIHFLAYADASNGTIASTINTDFVELEFELNLATLPNGNSTKSYTPYQLNYQLATAVEEVVLSDGAIALQNGGNQIELLEGVVVREETKPVIYEPTQRYYINNITPEVFSTRLINRTNNILSVYRNGVHDNKWTIRKDWSIGYGGSDASIPANDFDVNAVYTVTYIVLDKHLYTSNVLDATLTYQSTLGGTVAKNTQDIADIKTHNGVQDWRLMLDEAYALNTRFDLYAHIGSRGFSHAIATQTEAGFISIPDKLKIDSIAAGAGTAGSATDTVIGTRTINDAIAIGTTDTDTPTNLFSKIGAMIRAITGKADWFTAPVKSLEALNTDKVDKVAGKQLSTEDYTTAEKTKLSGVAANANNYAHPANHPPSIITQDASNRFVTDAEKAAWNAKAAQTDVGTISALLTSTKSNTVAAINELFTSASNGKTAVAAAITGKGVPASGADTFAQLVTKINAIQDWVYNSGNVVQAKSEGRYTYATGPTTVSVLEITKGGTFKIEFGLSTNNVAYIAYAQIYKNEVPYGTLRSSSEWQTPLVFSEELSYSTGDKVQIKAWVDRTDGLSNVINIVVKSSLQIPYFSF